MNALLLALFLARDTAFVKPAPGTDITWSTQVAVSFIVVYAGGYDVELGSTASFSARAFDGLNRAIPNVAFTWSATNGTMTGEGQFKADGILGPYTVTASAQNVTGGAGGNVVAASSPASLLVDSLDSQWPINEGSGTAVKERVMKVDAVGGTTAFKWGIDPQYGAFINLEGASPVRMPCTSLDPNVNLITSTTPVGFTQQVFFRPHDALYHGLQYIGDTDTHKTARFVTYVNFKWPGASYVDPSFGYISTSYRDSSNTVHFVTFKYAATNPPPVLKEVRVVDQGRFEVWANLDTLGNVIDGMRLQASASDCDLAKTWQASPGTTDGFYLGGILQGVMPRVDMFLFTLWKKSWDAATIQGIMYSSPLGMYR